MHHVVLYRAIKGACGWVIIAYNMIIVTTFVTLVVQKIWQVGAFGFSAPS